MNLLRYEEDEGDLEAEALSIAVVRAKSPLDGKDTDNSEDLQTVDEYLPSDRILTRMKVNLEEREQFATKNSTSMNGTKSSFDDTQGKHAGLDSLFQVPGKRPNDSNEVRKSESSENSWDMIGGKSVSTGRCGPKRGILKTNWNRSASIISGSSSRSATSVETYGKKNKSSEDAKGAAASLFAAARGAMSDDTFQTFKSKLAELKKLGDENKGREYVECGANLVMFLLEFKEQKLASLFLPVLPKQCRESIKILAKEKIAERKTKRAKNACSVTNSLQKATNVERSFTATMATESSKRISLPLEDKKRVAVNATGTANELLHDDSKRARFINSELSSSNTKRIVATKSTTISEHESLSERNPLDSCLKEAAESSFLSSLKLNSRYSKSRRIVSNVPKGLICTICNTAMNKPLLAECGHSACSHCWDKWLKVKAQKTCPICRKPTSVGALSHIVFQKEDSVEKIPTLSQICPREDFDIGDE